MLPLSPPAAPKRQPGESEGEGRAFAAPKRLRPRRRGEGSFHADILLTLWRTGFQRAASGLLGDPDEAISRTAALSCGRLGLRDPHVILKLIELLNNQYPTAREQSQAALLR